MPTRADFTIYQGETLAKPFYWYAGDPVIRGITGITRAFPPVVTAVGHGLPVDEIPVQIYSVRARSTIRVI